MHSQASRVGAAVSGVSKRVLMAIALFVMPRAGVTVSSPGGAGHALLFRDHVVLKKDFKVGGLAESLRRLAMQQLRTLHLAMPQSA
jgi:hypothetical protein